MEKVKVNHTHSKPCQPEPDQPKASERTLLTLRYPITKIFGYPLWIAQDIRHRSRRGGGGQDGPPNGSEFGHGSNPHYPLHILMLFVLIMGIVKAGPATISHSKLKEHNDPQTHPAGVCPVRTAPAHRCTAHGTVVFPKLHRGLKLLPLSAILQNW
ncbi:hypothetical protein JZ751_006186 [Albula glossodonta]|uniref:Uncharacterized protein n=1 Tax=Albula glossodonta TaxID=121402 RepID=A0A8T2N422_9TELE|nr:hypothetical protein JZ751_006186 [Albula glossodonta]